eukprot:GILI01008392.1.p1 GENE.GILI01008392.1~~GILI01008392.1.p1  ORF type:complete len:310 (-),score=46.60 GILI01008392.1:82-1011(-)
MLAAPTPESIALEYLNKYPGLPLKAFWESLIDMKNAGPDVPMAIVLHPSCGIERRSVKEEGPMASPLMNANLAKVIEFGATPIIIAAQANRPDVLEALIDADANPCEGSEDSWLTALHAAAANNTVESICLLIEHGENVDVYLTENRRTPLHVAALCGHVEAIQALLEGKAEVEAFDKDEWTPLHLAAQNGHVAAIEALIDDGGADPNASIVEGAYPIHFAGHNNHVPAIEMLLAKGAQVNATFQHGHTALHMAAQYGHVGAIAALLKGDADVTILAGAERLTAWKLAEKHGHAEAIKAFQEPSDELDQ